jgi:hypothetical protein
MLVLIYHSYYAIRQRNDNEVKLITSHGIIQVICAQAHTTYRGYTLQRWQGFHPNPRTQLSVCQSVHRYHSCFVILNYHLNNELKMINL